MNLPARVSAAFALGLVAASAVGAPAEEFTTQYTSTAAKSCKKVDTSKPSDGGDWETLSCRGVGGQIVRIAEDDLRTAVSIGRNLKAAENEPAARQSFGPFNYVNDTLEWRTVKGATRSFAVIQRWMIADNENLDPNGRPLSAGLMVVTRLGAGSVCHVAYIDVKANPEANVLARKAADETARGFDCADKPAIVGARGRAIELAVPK